MAVLQQCLLLKDYRAADADADADADTDTNIGWQAELSRFVEEKLLMHKRSARSLHLNGSIKSGATSLFGGGASMVLPTSNNAGTIFKVNGRHCRWWKESVRPEAAWCSCCHDHWLLVMAAMRILATSGVADGCDTPWNSFSWPCDGAFSR